MDLIDRYIAAVRRHLPAARQDDIAQELRDSLRSDAEEREQELARPLSEDEQSELLKKHGHPWLMASRYRPQQYLIGPALYPYYRQALTASLFWVVLPITLFGGAIRAIMADDLARIWPHVIGAAWNGGIYAIGIVTIVFAILEHERVRITALDRWDPKQLPRQPEVRTVPRSESLISLVVTLTFVVWWIGVVRGPDSIRYSGESVQVTGASIWLDLYWPILLVAAGSAMVCLLDLVRPWRSAPVSVVKIVVGLAQIAVVVMLFRAGTWVEVSADATGAVQAARVAFVLNNTVRICLAGIATVAGWEILREAWLMVKARGQHVLAF